MKVPEYFPDNELSCKCGCGLMLRPWFAYKVYIIRIVLGVPFWITSAARCERYNARVGGSNKSTHIDCIAVDGIAESPTMHKTHEYRIIQVAQAIGINGIGIKDNGFIHLDGREKPAIWGYPNK